MRADESDLGIFCMELGVDGVEKSARRTLAAPVLKLPMEEGIPWMDRGMIRKAGEKPRENEFPEAKGELNIHKGRVFNSCGCEAGQLRDEEYCWVPTRPPVGLVGAFHCGW